MSDDEKVITIEQEDCINFEGKPLIIQAGPGAGKTFVLVERIKHLLNDKKVDPESLLVITFTRKAADELKIKLSKEKDIGISKVNKMFINTIHAFCISFLSENGYSDIDLLESTENNERKAMFLRKHKKDLGFTREAYISGSGLKDVINKFEEYMTFGVNTKKLVSYIEETRPVSDEYKELIASCGEGDDFEYPYYEVSQSKELKQSRYNARYLAIAKAYPEYIKLLEQENSFDFNYLQLKVRDILKDNKDIAQNTRFKNIFIDEYQDIDPIQNDIFNLLLESSDTFTVVGDDDQSIYAFRGSVPKYFVNFSEDNEDNVLKLSKNFRSCRKIVEYNEDYIEPIREFEKKCAPVKEKEGGVYYLINEDEDTQAERIADIILHLRENGKIKQYSDIGLLLSSVNYADGVKNLITALTQKKIPFNLSENGALMSNEEVKAMIILLWYMRETDEKIILSNWEKDWLNNNAFTEVKEILNLDSSTCEILSSIEENYQQEMLETEKIVYKELCDKSSKIKKFTGIFNRPPEVIDEVFKRVERFDISTKTREDLIQLGITNEHDLNLFEKLYNLKQKIYDENIEFYERPSILNVYYEILQYSGILKDRLNNPTEENQRILRNLGIITETISNYEDIVTKYSINGLLWYIFQEFDNYSTQTIPSDSVDKVQIMTVHKSKGLEFPVVILASIKEGKFPKNKELDAKQKDYINGSATYPTPIDCLEHKSEVFKVTAEDMKNGIGTPEQKENNEENRESERVYYVGTTRAEEILILSSLVDDEGNAPEKEIQEIQDNPSYIELTDDYSSIIEAKCEEKEPEKEKLKLSYTHFSEYNNCGQEYNLRYNYMFKNSKTKAITFGQVAHTILNLIHQKQINYQKEGEEQVTSTEEVTEIINRVKEFNNNIDDETGEFTEIEEAIYKYWENYKPCWNYEGKEWEILASEVPFTLTENDYDLEGKIDLIIKDKESNDIIIIDFKTTKETNQTKLKERYQKQLFTYAMAIKQTPEYEKYNIKEAMIYSVKYSQPIPVPVNDVDIDEITESLNTTVEKILSGNFKPCKDTSKCYNCEYNKSICRRI